MYAVGLTSLILLMLATACTSQVPQIIKTRPGIDPDLTQVVDHAEKYKTQQVRWGGVILNTDNRAKSTRLTILAMPLNDEGEPKIRSASWGRFIASFADFLEPSVYANSRMITIVGNIQGLETLKVGEYPYPHPVVRVSAHYLWPQIQPPVNSDWPPYWYDPWYYPYPYYRPYRPMRP